jgi:hypothetical protein
MNTHSVHEDEAGSENELLAATRLFPPCRQLLSVSNCDHESTWQLEPGSMMDDASYLGITRSDTELSETRYDNYSAPTTPAILLAYSLYFRRRDSLIIPIILFKQLAFTLV